MIGRTLSHYRVLKQLGAGGMGVVYLARDTRLERDVAIKVLPKEVARDSDRLARFRREAKVLASLNHSNIGAIYGLEEPKRGAVFLVLEWIDGETLAARLQRGPLPRAEALAVCAHIAGALAAAHERGVIHRDLKPANVMLTTAGHAKVLDFGLARQATVRTTASTTTFVTKPGVAMGTVGYASPEQIRGQEHDGRADIFAFGCVLYECLTGRRAFPGGTAADVLEATLNREPDWTALPLETPEKVRGLLVRCLAKDPQDRLGAIADALIEIDEGWGGGRISRAREVAGKPHNLPHELTSFLGREAEIAECRRLFSHCRLLTLTGAGGCGKTRLLLRLGALLLDGVPDGVQFVDLAPVTEGSRVALEVASALGVREEPAEPISQTLTSCLRHWRGLLLLDNCEHLRASCAELSRLLLSMCPEMALLVTSREGLGVPGEQIYEVRPLPVPDLSVVPTVSSIGSFDGVRLFMERAALVRPGFQLTDSNAVAVAEICRRLDGIPLALELAAARTRAISTEEIRARLDDRFRLLVSGDSVPHPRHQTLKAVVQWSYDQLTGVEQRLFQVMAIFSGGWTLGAATAVFEDGQDEIAVLDLLASLVDKSLVVVTESGPGISRYGFLETIREFALQVDPGKERDARRRHRDYFLAFAEEAERRLTSDEDSAVPWLELLEAEHENLLAGLAWTRAAEDVEVALRMAAALGAFWNIRGHYGLARKNLEEILAMKGAGSRVPARAKILYYVGKLKSEEGDFERAWALGEESCSIYRELGDIKGTIDTLLIGAWRAIHQNDLETAHRLGDDCLSIARSAGYTRGIISALEHISVVFKLEGDFASSRKLLLESLALSRSSNAQRKIARDLLNLAHLDLKVGDWAEGRASLTECLQLILELGDKPQAGDALEVLGWWAGALQRPSVATRFLGAAEVLRESMGIRPASFLPVELEEAEAVAHLARSRLGEARFAAESAVGRALSFDAAIREALRWLESDGKGLKVENLDPRGGPS